MPATYIAQPILEIDGQRAPAALIEDILQISVEESLHLPGAFTLVIKNDYFPGRVEDQTWRHEGLFEIGKSIKIGFTSSTTTASEFEQEREGYLLEGEITGMETHFTSTSQAPMVIRGYDISHRLHRGRYNRSFQNMTDTDILKKIAGEVGMPTGRVDNAGGPYGYGDVNGSNGYVFQENQTNMEFLRERAARNGFELFVRDGKLNFCKPQVESSLALKWLRDIHSFRVRVTSAEQVSEVEVRGWDYSQKRPIVESATSGQVMTRTERGQGSNTSTVFKGKPPTPTMSVVDRPFFNAPEAKTMAQSLCNELEGEFVRADARGEGNPEIRPGRAVKLSDLGKYSGDYYITETRHLFCDRVYTTEFSVRGMRGGDLLDILSPPTHLRPGQTLMVGIVTDNKDPNGWGRVRVKFPTLTEEHASYWARVVGTGAGSSRGFDCLPEINDEVLVAFEHGDIHHPYVIAGVWNGKDKPPENVQDTVVDGKVRLRTLKTRTGHVLQFVEEDKGASKKGIYVDTVYGHRLHFNDTERLIELKTKAGQTLVMDDKGAKIDMTARGKITLTVGASKIEMTPASINIQSTQVTVNGTAQARMAGGLVNIQASGINTIQGALVKIN